MISTYTALAHHPFAQLRAAEHYDGVVPLALKSFPDKILALTFHVTGEEPHP
jgi:hypothetical protein